MSSKTRLMAIATVFVAVLGSKAYADDSKFINGGACYPTVTLAH